MIVFLLYCLSEACLAVDPLRGALLGSVVSFLGMGWWLLHVGVLHHSDLSYKPHLHIFATLLCWLTSFF